MVRSSTRIRTRPDVQHAHRPLLLKHAAARYVDVFMEAIRWDNAIKLYERYSRES
jgi:hypothetical protein